VIIVSDSGPIAFLVQIGMAGSLPTLYGHVYVPPTVISELGHEDSPIAAWANQPPDWLVIGTPHSIPTELDLDQGELEAIVLAIELAAD
jgi:predicted nucleic acid-binding protein